MPAEVELPVQMEVREMVVSTEHRACFISGFRDLEKYPYELLQKYCSYHLFIFKNSMAFMFCIKWLLSILFLYYHFQHGF